MSVSLTREEFWELLWSEPQSALAIQFGVSDSAIGKAARKTGIPRPGPGYWQKIRNGKKVVPVPLPQRFPGGSNWIHIGGSKWQQDPVTVDKDEIPVEPVFGEPIEDLQGRVIKMVGKVSLPTIARATHPITKKLLDHDAECRRAIEENRYTWNKPKFDTPIEKRRLRIFNALFLKLQAVGCRSYMSTSKYGDYNEGSFQVGDQHVRVMLETVEPKQRGRQKIVKKPFLKVAIHKGWKSGDDKLVWEDTDSSRIEDHLTEIVIEIVMHGEKQYRKGLQWRYEWAVQEREERLEKERLERIEKERLAREKQEQEEKERIDYLLLQAEAIRKAEKIRAFVAEIESRIAEIDRPIEDIHVWAAWATKQADSIDPIKNMSFLDMCVTTKTE